ncbi:MAG: hypothetical protein H7122_06875 [Chitinophagaceae bacterium]|nr:hypothetical protein [Chitinophagaceae bacterium]
MKNKSDKTRQDESTDNEKSPQAYQHLKDKDKNTMGNDVSSEIKIANAGGELEGGDNKQWHMDQGNFDEQEKKDFENCDEKK